MDKERLKLIVRNMESLLDCLKAELYVPDNNLQYSEVSNYHDRLRRNLQRRR
jgi:hypothetical protein